MRKKILLIEDDKIVRENIESLLTEENYIVYSSKSGDEGITIAKRELPDLILCDIMMKGKDGYGVLKELSSDESTNAIPFIFLTAKVEKEDIRTGMNLGADDYLFKPFDAEDLLTSINSRLKRIDILKGEIASGNVPAENTRYTMEDKIFIQANNKTFLVNISDIISICAERQYVNVTMSNGKSYLLRKSITYWESVLPEKKFLRIHRSTIINIDSLTKMETWFNSGYLIYLKNIDKPLVISRRYAIKLRGKFYHPQLIVSFSS